MAKPRVFSLDAVRTDGWFERIGQGIGSFQALCEIVGERFFAFSMITGARITALTVDRRNPDNTIVDFVVEGGDADDLGADVQRLTLGDFRRRLVGALLSDDAPGPVPERDTDVEGVQLHIGIRYLLLAPLYGYSLRRLEGRADGSILHLARDGVEESYTLEEFRARLRTHIRDELERATSEARGAIDLARVADAEVAALAGDAEKVVQILGMWPPPLAIFWRTPEGQMLPQEVRALIAKGLGLLGGAYVKLGDVERGEEVFRLAVQYAQEGVAAAEIFRRLGEAMLSDGRPGEAVGPLRRALKLGADRAAVLPDLARAFVRRQRWVAALACTRDAIAAGVAETALAEEIRSIEAALGPTLTAWRAAIARAAASVAPGPPTA